MFTYEMTAVGIEHEHSNTPCEDHVKTFQWGSVMAEVCADGVGGSRMGGEEAKRLSAELAQFLAMYFRQLREMSAEQASAELLRVIRSVQADLMQETGVAMTDLGCTVAAAAMDRHSHAYFGVNLGDGILLAREYGRGNICTILPPEKCSSEAGTYLTTDPDEVLLAHIRTVRGRSKDALMVSSDGLEHTLWDTAGERVSATVGKLMDWVVEDPVGVRTEFAEAVYDLSLQDDACVAVMVDRRVRTGAYEGKDPTQLCQRRREARRYMAYLRYRDAGYSRSEAARRAGWHPTQIQRNVSYLKSIGLD